MLYEPEIAKTEKAPIPDPVSREKADNLASSMKMSGRLYRVRLSKS